VGIDAELAALVEPLPASDYLVAEVRQQRMDSAAYKLNQSRQLLNALPDGSRMCPVCQTPADTLAPRVAEVQRLLPQLENDYVDLARRDRRDREYERTLADVRARRAALEQSRQQNMLKLQEAQQAVGTPPVMPREEVAVAWQQACLNASNLTMTEQFLASLQPQLHGQEGRLVALEGELQQTRKQLAELADYTAEEVAAAKQRSAGAAHMAITIAACSAARSVATSSLKNIEAEIAQAIEASQRAAGMLAWQRVVQTGCDLLHPMAAPRAVVQRRLTEQLVDVNGYLDSFGADFRVRIDAEANIHAIMHRGYEQPAARLSHGQLSRLAFAFRLAINLSQAAGINALYLDEPTAFLDYQSLDHFEAVFRRLRTMAAERSFQCWIITHAQRLTSLFDQVVEV
jgi:DNA repair exonuclease SbcCD ATPase subunit